MPNDPRHVFDPHIQHVQQLWSLSAGDRAMSTRSAVASAFPRGHLRPSARRALLSAHVISSVGLLGASSALLVLAVSGATTSDPQLADSAYRFMATFGYVFGIPLSFSSLITGVTLGLGTKWGVLRYPWVTAKLILLVTTILSGALVIGPGAQQMIDGTGGAGTRLIVAAAYNVTVLVASAVLSVYKPGRRRRAR
jgi:hypothetical protein